MADQTSPIQPIEAATNAATRLNENFDAASPAMLYGRDARTTTTGRGQLTTAATSGTTENEVDNRDETPGTHPCPQPITPRPSRRRHPPKAHRWIEVYTHLPGNFRSLLKVARRAAAASCSSCGIEFQSVRQFLGVIQPSDTIPAAASSIV